MYTRNTKNLGVNTNLNLEPSANSQSSQHITNNIIVKGQSEEPVIIEKSVEFNSENSLDKSVEKSVEKSLSNESKETLDQILLGIYQSILLSQNKVLLANILSKKHIIIYKNDLERVITSKIGKRCSVVLKDCDDCGCTAKSSPFSIIESIVVYENDARSADQGCKRVDFHVGYNADYVELSEKYALCLKVCLTED